MKARLVRIIVLCGFIFTCAPVNTHGDTFGEGTDAFTSEFATIGNSGNRADIRIDPEDNVTSFGAVSYVYRLSITEVPQEWVAKAVSSGLMNVMAGAWLENQPAAEMSWYEAAAFVNWLNTSRGHQKAYDLSFDGTWNLALWNSAEAWQLDGENLYRHRDAYYFLPSEHEWYKAAYHHNEGGTSNYWDYPTGSNEVPVAVASGTQEGTAVFRSITDQPAAVGASGGLSSYGTRGQGGNVWEWQESAFDGTNDDPTEDRVVRGGNWDFYEFTLHASTRVYGPPTITDRVLGLRVASVPEPCVSVLLIGIVIPVVRRRPRCCS